jgi:DNA polymerase III epsilon subunit family exonuclease
MHMSRDARIGRIAKQWSGPREFVAFDTETTGLNPKRDHVVEVAGVRFDVAGRELASFRRLVRPPCSIPPSARRVHGISDDDVADQPAIDAVLGEFFEFLRQPCVLVAHNAWFDVDFLWSACRRLDLEPPDYPVVDCILLARRRLKLYSYSLAAIGQHLGLAETVRHRAADDTQTLKAVFTHLLHRPRPIASLDALFQLAGICYFHELNAYVDDRPRVLRILKQAIRGGHTLSIVYHGGSFPGSTRNITPVELDLELGHVLAHCHRTQQERVFRIDKMRILERQSAGQR